MNEKNKAILVGLTGKKKRSRLMPHRELICKLHQRGCPFREIVRILSENFSLTVAHTTICRFIARLKQEEPEPQRIKSRKEKPVPIIQHAPGTPVPTPVASSDEVRQRIAALKQRPAQLDESDTKRFNYNPDQPLHLVHEKEKT